ncbi:hypothetical protein [Sphingomonas pseudosanguinis]|uniref:Uncharacterized protein n=1 Tax=Sphingomonas pseudosanguinis TaxID=413712 RepID=A0A7W6A981_9SPHN|nr:hypothetical protein [Sphingomonas pseudosanguinis]MBB3877928.1 hypothetical protein [Sphingomonas pseudosanguinis]
MTTKRTNKERILTALAVALALLAIPFVLIGMAGAAKERRR